ncbi:CLUMA_CG013664, isoform A [Clunio marinus]|uniref:CLUMA_CG013664, isoform A n=1 Tax=Clunio marinus TaxID=568069 RepID=A0A1J1IJH7_9DIPT|nr:CLUMA_CG013664, isoform A [Clunio marinus]
MAFKLFVVLVAVGIPMMVQGYSSGAPAEECSTMTPRHGVEPQTGPSPYDIILDKNNIRAGETVGITIRGRSNDDTFKGLLVQARVGDTPIGSFDVSPSRQYIQTLSCGNGRNNAVTHKKIDQGVHEVKLYWIAPSKLAERVNFYFTVAKNGGVFWVAQKSETLNVK